MLSIDLTLLCLCSEIKVVLELPLQTVSCASEWFQASANRSVGFDDWIVWRDGDAEQAPEVCKQTIRHNFYKIYKRFQVYTSSWNSSIYDM